MKPLMWFGIALLLSPLAVLAQAYLNHEKYGKIIKLASARGN